VIFVIKKNVKKIGLRNYFIYICEIRRLTKLYFKIFPNLKILQNENKTNAQNKLLSLSDDDIHFTDKWICSNNYYQ